MSPEKKRCAVVTLLLVLCAVPGSMGRVRGFPDQNEFLPYTRQLPAIDKIELLKLKLQDNKWDGGIAASKVLKGAEAQRVASLWRRQTYTASISACHEPAYAIKFYAGEKVIAYASICWSCNSIYFIAPDLHRTQSFGGGDKRGEQLSELFRLAFTAPE